MLKVNPYNIRPITLVDGKIVLVSDEVNLKYVFSDCVINIACLFDVPAKWYACIARVGIIKRIEGLMVR